MDFRKVLKKKKQSKSATEKDVHFVLAATLIFHR